jgi:hypothetical protein
MNQEITNLIISIGLLLFVLHIALNMLGYKNAVPNNLKKIVRKTIYYFGRFLLQTLRSIFQGIVEGIKDIRNWWQNIP